MVVGLVLSGCSLVDRFTGDPPVPELSESSLDRLLLSERQINEIVGGPDARVTFEGEELADTADVVSDRDCLGVVFDGEERVYRGSGVTAQRREELEDEDQAESLITQTVVLFSSADRARQFFDDSVRQWQECANTSLDRTLDDGTDIAIDIRDVGNPREDVVSVTIAFPNSDCSHAMGVVSNLVAEARDCGGSAGEAETIATTIIDNAADTARAQ